MSKFGTGETSAAVPAKELKPGVRIDPWYFAGHSISPLIVDRVQVSKSTIGVWAVRSLDGHEFVTAFPLERKITTWGTLGED